MIEFALEHEELTTQELAVKYTDEKRYFVSESSAYRILKAADLITALDYVVIKAADEFKDKTTAINEIWQPDPDGTGLDRGTGPRVEVLSRRAQRYCPRLSEIAFRYF